MQVIFNADDFGLTKGVNNGIKQAHVAGVVRSTTLMAGMDEEQHAVELVRDLPQLKVGLHLRFTAGSPLTSLVSLVGKQDTSVEGLFPGQPEFWAKQDFNSQDIADEVEAQLAHFRRLGLSLSHIDSHHHAHTHPQLLPVISEIAHGLKVPLRGVAPSYNGAKLHRYCFSDHFYDKKISLESLLQLIDNFHQRCDVLEIMCHPGYFDPKLAELTSYGIIRELELEVLTSPTLQEELQLRQIQVGDYSLF